jgi:hypothetical protein
MADRYLVEIFVPLFDRAGKRFPKRLHAALRRKLVEEFGGMTAHLRAPAVGLWKATDRSPPERDHLVVYEVMTQRLDRSWWANYRRQLERDFRQEELLIRVHKIRVL